MNHPGDLPCTFRVINTIGACLVAIDATSEALLAMSVISWDGAERAKTVNTLVVALQLVALCGKFN